ncbi:TraB/GumN family protein [Sphingomonas sp. GCM10030256]|uniref:TraB/GumN family protein n=1 Tax=Sphingomonas sp. GCM10030256 TaxID=3273427 RepID=UPI003606B0DA
MALKWLKRGLAAFGLAAAASACTTADTTAAQQGPKPALWQVADRDTTVYLFGTIHLLPQNYSWRSPKFEAAVQRSNALVVETLVDEKNPAALLGELMRLGLSSNLPPLLNRVSPDKRAALQAAVQRSGVPMAALDRMETWAAAFTLIGTQFRSLGLQSDQGVETVLRQAFTAAGKPVDQLETNSEQLSFFDTLPADAQLKLLEGAIERPEEVRQQFDGMLAAWARGDVNAIAQTFNTEMEGSPALEDALLRRRNANWAGWIQRRLAQPGAVMVAVGAGHLAGDASVQALLQQRGLKVTRIQ